VATSLPPVSGFQPGNQYTPPPVSLLHIFQWLRTLSGLHCRAQLLVAVKGGRIFH
jgi:hypothetical protein